MAAVSSATPSPTAPAVLTSIQAEVRMEAGAEEPSGGKAVGGEAAGGGAAGASSRPPLVPQAAGATAAIDERRRRQLRRRARWFRQHIMAGLLGPDHGHSG